MSDITANVNSAQCIQTMHGWGADVAYNVCAGTKQTMPWGAVEYVIWGFIVVFFTVAILTIFGFIGALAHDAWSSRKRRLEGEALRRGTTT